MIRRPECCEKAAELVEWDDDKRTWYVVKYTADPAPGMEGEFELVGISYCPFCGTKLEHAYKDLFQEEETVKLENVLVHVVKIFEHLAKETQEILQEVCPHRVYTTHRDPTAHRCNLCGAYLETDEADGTGEVLVPHRVWTGGKR